VFSISISGSANTENMLLLWRFCCDAFSFYYYSCCFSRSSLQTHWISVIVMCSSFWKHKIVKMSLRERKHNLKNIKTCPNIVCHIYQLFLAFNF
jgi:hypothetical protein